MLNAITLFFILFIFWIFNVVLIGINPLLIFIGLIISSSIAFICWRLNIIGSKSSFMILQFGFYKFIFSKISQNLSNVFRLSFQFLNPKHEFKPIIDYIFLDKDKDSEIALGVNLITFLAGTICVAVKKRYVIIHSLGTEYFSPAEMYDISSQLDKVYDDTLE